MAEQTTYAWDDSHYGAPPTARDGIDMYTHKLTDGDHYYEDAEYKLAMEAARRLGIPILGPYHVLHGRKSIERQALWLVERATKLTPWWQDWPDWTWQIDAEAFSYLTTPTIDEVNAFGWEIVRLTGCPSMSVEGYCPYWVYRDGVKRLDFPWWQSNYGLNPAVPYRQAYPGNHSDRWDGPISPLLLQYGSRTIIAGQPTSDANAFRGTLDELKKTLKGHTMPQDLSKEILATNARVQALAQMKTEIKTSWASNPDGVETQQEVVAILDLQKRMAALETAVAAVGETCAKCAEGGDDGGPGTAGKDYIVTGTVRMHEASE